MAMKIRYTSCASRGRDVPGTGNEWRKTEHRQMLELRSSQYTNCVTTFDKDNMLFIQYGDPIKF